MRLNGRDEDGFALDFRMQEVVAYERRLRAACAKAKTDGIRAAARSYRMAVNTIRNAMGEHEEDA